MTDQPLFQNSDEQEAIYAPQQLPDGSAAKQAADQENAHRADGGDVVFVPGAAAGGAGAGGTGPSTGAGTLSGVAPAAIPALHEQAHDEDE